MSGTHGTIWWSELRTRAPEVARAYYGAVCGWSWEAMPGAEGGGYQIASAGGRPVAGLIDISGMPGMEDAPAHWFTYVAVDDVDAAARATEERGARVLRGPWDVPGVGRIAIVEDPGGAAVGLMTPAEMPA